MKLFDIIEVFIAGDWGEKTYSKETPCAVTCVRGADIIPISEYDFSAIPVRYISQQAYAKKCLQVGDIICYMLQFLYCLSSKERLESPLCLLLSSVYL